MQIKVQGLSFSYDGHNDALKDLSFELKAGTSLSIIGHNGSGKSTLAKLLVGLLAAPEGTISLFGQPVTKKTMPSLRKRIGIVFQNPDNQFIATTVRDDIAFGLENRNVAPAEMDPIIQRAASMVGLSNELDKEPQHLSGGQKQRAAIAAVLALAPEILILDEATAMLDPRGRKEVGEAIASLKAADPKLTVISITHDIEEAFQSDRLLVLHQGRIVFDDVPAAIRKKAAELRSFHLDVPFLDRVIMELRAQGIMVDEATSLDTLAEMLCR